MLATLSAPVLLLSLVSGLAPTPAPAARAATLAAIQEVDARVADRAAEPWAEVEPLAPPRQVLDAVVQSVYLASEPTRDLISLISEERFDPASLVPLTERLDASPQFFAANVRTWLGRELVTAGSIDEAALLLESVDPAATVDPAAALFFRAVCEHNALDKEAGLKTIEQLLDGTEAVPERYAAVARLMRQDLEDLSENEMQQLAHQMKNVERRLQQGRSGEKTQEQEQKILSDLDKMIEQMEQQLQQMQGGEGQADESAQPMDDSRIAGAPGEGKVDERPIGRKDGWGNLPDKEQTEAKNLINRQFPSHYRQAVEEYLKRLAERPAE